MLTYDLKVLRPNGSTSRYWRFEAESDFEAKSKTLKYLRERHVTLSETPELKLIRDDQGVKVELPSI